MTRLTDEEARLRYPSGFCSTCAMQIPSGFRHRHVESGLEWMGGKDDSPPWRWLASTVDLQRESFGFDWEKIGRGPVTVAASLKDNSFAIYQELAEGAVEYSWKHWATDDPFVNRDRVLAELVDVGHFMANMLIALDVSDDEWEREYKAKQARNRARMATGTYSARKGGLGEGSDA